MVITAERYKENDHDNGSYMTKCNEKDHAAYMKNPGWVRKSVQAWQDQAKDKTAETEENQRNALYRTGRRWADTDSEASEQEDRKEYGDIQEKKENGRVKRPVTDKLAACRAKDTG